MLSYSWIFWFMLPFIVLAASFVVKPDLAPLLFSDSRFWAALGISLVSAFVVIGIAVFFAIPTAYFLAYRRFRYQNLVEAMLIDIPQTFPPVAVGVIYLFTFGTNSPIDLAFTFAAVIIAKLIISAPFVLSYTLRKFREIRESKLDLVARSLGAGTGDVMFRVLLPLAKKDIATGLTLSWARAMGEFGGSLIFAGVIAYKTEILPTYTNRVVGVDPFLALAATAIMTAFALFALVIIRRMLEPRVK